MLKLTLQKEKQSLSMISSDTCMAKTDDYASFLDEKTHCRGRLNSAGTNVDDSESDVSGDLEFD